MNQLVQNKFCNVSNLINPSLRKRLGFTPQESGQMQPAAETRWQMILEYFPPKWTPVRRRKCDKRIESGAHPCSVLVGNRFQWTGDALKSPLTSGASGTI